MRSLPKVMLLLAALLLTGACSSPRAPGDQAAPPASPSPTRPLTIAAASDLQFAFAEIGKRFEAETGEKVTFTFGSTGSLGQQVENGAPVDLFAGADVKLVDGLREKGFIIAETQKHYAVGRIVVAAGKASGLEVKRLEDLLDPQVKHVAIANPDHAPYGLAAKQAMIKAGIWDEIQPKLVLGENIRQALQFVQTGNAEAGVIALSIAEVPEISYTLIDDALHAPIIQALGVIKGSPREQEARAFATFVMGPEGQAIMQKYGFQSPPR